MNSAIVWMLTFAFTGPNAPPSGEQAKFKTKEECIAALEQKKQESKKQGITAVGSCVLTDKKS
jgi:hypothetical protein